MPIKVIKLEVGYRSNRTKFTPGLNLIKRHGSLNKYVEDIRIENNSSEFIGSGYQNASQVYITSEIDSKFSNAANQIDTLKEEFNSDISKSLNEILSIKEEMIKDKVFIDHITH